MKLIELKHVEKSFNGRKIIKDMNFSINTNEVVALVGTNGAGKTTTIRMILGITSQIMERLITGQKISLKK
ncbi:ATP-binding cassette domain-containing protein [Bacillus sp. JCM 19034]|uniref:ATP-binding cassette domain-containing protein n=1 Tax=Bacillus sp. JCM 19034 TaxID=1481928 RepID=UPI000AF0EE74|nr:ATP-binding cassette domain-containing protein [Bacillus sp. JCM 19034]